jgi:hypothetical protein
MRRLKKNIKKQCDKLWSEIIRSIGQCERCGRTDKKLEAAHIYSRRYANTRHDLENGICLCTGCHFWAHQNPVDFTHWIEERIGRDKLDDLREKKERVSKVDYNLVVEHLKDIHRRL